MAQIGAVFVFCSSCKILYFANSVHPKNATVILMDHSPFERTLQYILFQKLGPIRERIDYSYALKIDFSLLHCRNMQE